MSDKKMPADEEMTDQIDPDFEQLLENLIDHDLQLFVSVIEEAFADNRELFIHSLTNQLADLELGTCLENVANQEAQEWIEVRSLSGLRNLVGGRFQTLKRRWLKSGFPLREHRGDVNDDFEVDQKGWVELSNWIYKQGYEARLTPDKEDCLFELIRKS